MQIFRPLITILLVALSYFVFGMLGQLMAIPPGYATLFWPASGVALGAALIWGYGALPGVFLGSFFVNLYISSASTTNIELLLLPGLIALGATLQAFVGAQLVNRLIGFPFPFHHPKQVIYFSCVGGVLSSLVNATTSCSVLLLMGVITPDAFPANWFNWWLGDTLGVIVLIPWLLVLFPNLSKAKVPNRRNLLLSLLLIACGTLLFALSITRFEQNKQAEQFNKNADMLALALESEIHAVINTLYGLKGHILSHEIQTPEMFRQYTQPVLQREEGLQGISWNSVITGSELDRFEREMTRLYANEGISFRVSKRNDDGTDVAESPDQKHVVVSFIAPLKPNLKALGYDVYSQRDRREALDLSAALGHEVVTRPIRLVQEKNSQAGVLIFLPVFSPHSEQVKGYVTAVVRVGNMAQHAFEGKLLSNTNLILMDTNAAQEKWLLYSQGEMDWNTVALPDLLAGEMFPLQRTNTVKVGNDDWTLVQVSSSSFLYQPWGVHLMVVCGLIISGLLNWFMVIVSGHAYDIEEQVAKRTTELAKINQVFASAEKLALVGNWERSLVTEELWWSDEMYRVFGQTRQNFQPTYSAFLDMLPPKDRERVTATIDAAIAEGQPYQLEHKICLPDESRKVVVHQGTVICDAEGNPVSLIGVVQDITQQKQAEQELQAQKQRLSEIIWSTNVGTWEWDIQTGEVIFNERWAEIVGLSLEDLLPGSVSVWHLLMHPDDLKTSQKLLEDMFTGHRSYYQFECRMRHRDGHWVWVSNRGKVIEWSETGDPLRMCGIETDITTRKQREAEIEKLATTDALTGLANRDYFNKRLTEVIKVAERTGQSFALMMLDLDGFKEVNDQFGHLVGDALLVEFARDLRSLCRETDIIARIGGDEFMIILTTLGELSGAETLAQRIIHQISFDKQIGGNAIQMGVSIGISLYSGATDELTLIQIADTALYEAKNTGRNSYVLSS